MIRISQVRVFSKRARKVQTKESLGQDKRREITKSCQDLSTSPAIGTLPGLGFLADLQRYVSALCLCLSFPSYLFSPPSLLLV